MCSTLQPSSFALAKRPSDYPPELLRFFLDRSSGDTSLNEFFMLFPSVLLTGYLQLRSSQGPPLFSKHKIHQIQTNS